MVQLRPGDHSKLAKYIGSKSFGFDNMGSIPESMVSDASSDQELAAQSVCVDR